MNHNNKTQSARRIPMMIFAALFTATILTALPAATINAQNGAMRHRQGPDTARAEGMGGGGMIEGLTQEQRVRIQEIHLKTRERMTPIDNQLREKRARLQTLSTGDTIDRNAAKKLIGEMADLQAERMSIRWETRQEVRAQLTDEQKIRFDSRGMGREGADGRRKGPHDQRMGPDGRTRQSPGARYHQDGRPPQQGRSPQQGRHRQGGLR